MPSDTNDEYAPLPRVVVELSKPHILGVYVNGKLRNDIQPTLEFEESRVLVLFREGEYPEIPGLVGPASNVEVRWYRK
jgi:hypothetical protein